MDFLYVFGNMIKFAAVYCMTKCLRTMVVGMLIIPGILLVRKGNGKRRADVNFYAMLMLIPAAVTGMSRFFFMRYIVYIPVIMYSVIRPVHGYIYFGVMAVLLGRYLWKNRRLGRRVHALPVWGEEELQRSISMICMPRRDCAATLRERLAGVAGRLEERYLRRVRVYVTKEAVSPFSGGLLHPYVVIPDTVALQWPEEERSAVLCHELVHIKSGHILWTMLFQLLKLYWWGNPVIYLCERLLREDMEMACDEQCIRYAKVSCGTYGRTLLNMIALMQGVSPEGTLCFSDRNDFQSVKKRMEGLFASAAEQNAERQHRKRRVVFAGVFAGMLALIAATSYPRYTKLDDLVLYDEGVKMLDYDSEALRSAVSVRDGRLVIDEEKFTALLEKLDVQGDYVYVSFDTILKVPGCGGGGNVGMVAVKDCSDIFYLSAESLENDIAIFWLKYLI